MERLFQPKTFDTDVNDTLAQQKWEHWLCTFRNLVAITQANAEEQMRLLINFVSTEVYSHIAQCENFEAAILKLNSLYIKPRNYVFNRYLLSSRKQLQGESIQHYVHSLRLLAQDCNFAKVCRSSKKNFSSCVSLNAASPQSTSLNNASVVTITISGREVSCLLDTGSSENFIDPKLVARLNLTQRPSRSSVTLASSIHSVPITGMVTSDIKFNGNLYPNINMSLMANLCFPVLLGLPFLAQHDEFTFKFKGPLPGSKVCNLIAMSTLPPCIFTNLVPSISPIAIPSRRYSQEDSIFIASEVKRLLSEDIIESCVSPWRAQVLVVREAGRKPRMVVDYSLTVNRFTQLDAYPLPRIPDRVNEISKYKLFSKIDLKAAYHQIPIHAKDKMFTAFEAQGNLYQFKRLPFGLKNAVAAFQRKVDELISENNLVGTYAYLDDVVICGNSTEDHNSNLRKFLDVAKEKGLTLNDDKCVYGAHSINYLGYSISHNKLSPDPSRLEPLKDMPAPLDMKSHKRLLGMLSYYSPWVPNFSQHVHPLLQVNKFPLSSKEKECYESLKKSIMAATIGSIDESAPFQLQTDASSLAIAAVLLQNQQPVAYFSRTLTPAESKYPSIELEALAVVEAVRKWRHLLLSKPFTIMTDQEAVSFIFNIQHKSKVKNNKLARWRLELSEFHYYISHISGRKNVLADTLSRHCNAIWKKCNLHQIHEQLCHPGVRRLQHYVRSKNLPFSVEEIKSVTISCKDCAEVKPRFYRPPGYQLIHASRPMERLALDFIGPKSSVSSNKYILMIVDEYTRFPFAFPCADITAKTVIKRLVELFSLVGNPNFIHSDRGAQFMSSELSEFLDSIGVARSRTTSYNPQGNGQCERLNGQLWKAVLLSLRTQKLEEKYWESVLPQALHSMRTLVNTRTNHTPHELFFKFDRLSGNGYSHPSWLVPGNEVLLRRHVRNKNDPLADKVQLLELHQRYASVRFPGGRTDTVSLRDLAPYPTSLNSDPTLVPNPQEIHAAQPNISNEIQDISRPSQPPVVTTNPEAVDDEAPETLDDIHANDEFISTEDGMETIHPHLETVTSHSPPNHPRRSNRTRKKKIPYDC